MAWRPLNSYDCLSASQAYGYGGNRTDLPSVGYSPENPSWRSDQQSSSNHSYYFQSASQQYSVNNEYNPVYPSYSGTYGKPLYAQIDPATESYRKPIYSQVDNNYFTSSQPVRYYSSNQPTFPRKNAPQSNFFNNSGSARQKRSNNLKPLSVTAAPKKTSKTARASATATNQSVPSPAPKPDIRLSRIQSSPAKKVTSPRAAKTTMSARTEKSSTAGVRKSPMKNNIGKNRKPNKGKRPGRFHHKYTGADLPVAAVDETTTPIISLNVNMDNTLLFHGFQSVFTTQHKLPVMIDGKIYDSVDHYYQVQKLMDLCGAVSPDLMALVRDSSGNPVLENASKPSKGLSQIAKEALKAGNVDAKVVEKWRMEGGLAAVQKGLLAKVSQSAYMREALKESGEKILVHAFAGDCIYGSGCQAAGIQRWCDDESTSKVYKIPYVYPLTSETLAMCPQIGRGRNVLGVILMQLRKRLFDGSINIDKTFDHQRLNDTFDMDTTNNADFAIGSSSFAAKK